MLPMPPASIIQAAKEKPMTHHAQGTFEVKVAPLGSEAEWGGFGRLSIDKRFSGAIEGTSRGQMMAEGNPATGFGGYVALERVTATLDGRKGTFALQHSGTMAGGAADMVVTVVPGSGTDGLKGIAGTFRIIIEAGKHSYAFDYTLPD